MTTTQEVLQNLFVKSENQPIMPPLNVSPKKFKEFHQFPNHQQIIIMDTLKAENKEVFRDQFVYFFGSFNEKLLPSTYLENFYVHRPTAEFKQYKREMHIVMRLMQKLLKEGYDQMKPILIKESYWERFDDRRIVLDGGQHRLQAIREIIYNRIPNNYEIIQGFKIPTLIMYQ